MPRIGAHIFLDESGTSLGDEFTLVGATVFRDVDSAESEIAQAFQRAAGNPSIWPDEARRLTFMATGYHFTEDSDTVRATLLDSLARMDFRAYAVYGLNSRGDLQERLLHMYGILLRSLIARYRDASPTYIFEQNSSLDGLYGQLWDAVRSEIDDAPSSPVLIGTKSAPCLAVTDYVLGVTRQHLAASPLPFQEHRFAALGPKYAYLVNYDDDSHAGGRRRPIL